jgi:hypothetical protein
MINKFALAKRLEREYGDEPERARQHARVLGDMLDTVATKRDIQELRIELRDFEQRLHGDRYQKINGVRAQEALRPLHDEINVFAWQMISMVPVQTIVIVALAKLSPGPS